MEEGKEDANNSDKEEKSSKTGPKEEAMEKEEDAEKESDNLKERLLRLAAEFDNYKKRSAKELDNAKGLGKAELMKKILPVLDEFELALESMDMKTENEKGIALIFSNFEDVVKKEGLKEVEAKGIYDPYRHEIVLTKDSSQKEGMILETIRKGYTLNGIMLRPSSVIVSKGPKQNVP